MILWPEDVPAAYDAVQRAGATPVKQPTPWLGRLVIAWVQDLDGHLIQLAQPSTDAPLGD